MDPDRLNGSYFVRISGGTFDALVEAVTILQRQPEVAYASWWGPFIPDIQSYRRPALIAPVATAVAQGTREPTLPPRIAIVAVDSELSPMGRALAEIASDRLEQLGSGQRVQVVRSRAVEDLVSTWPTHFGDEDYRVIGRLLRVTAMLNVAMLRETPPVAARAIVHPPGRRVPPDTLPLFDGASVAAVGDALARYVLTEIIPRASRVQAVPEVKDRTRGCTGGPGPYFEFQVDRMAELIASDSPRPRPAAPSASGARKTAALVQFVVDTVGTPNLDTFKTLVAASQSAADSARAIVARWRFSPAILTGCKVAQMVQVEVQW